MTGVGTGRFADPIADQAIRRSTHEIQIKNAPKRAQYHAPEYFHAVSAIFERHPVLRNPGAGGTIS
jgi:hypothetical protein